MGRARGVAAGARLRALAALRANALSLTPQGPRGSLPRSRPSRRQRVRQLTHKIIAACTAGAARWGALCRLIQHGCTAPRQKQAPATQHKLHASNCIQHRSHATACAASSPFYWLRIQGFQQLAAALEAGVACDPAALGASLDQTYSQGELRDLCLNTCPGLRPLCCWRVARLDV